MNWCITAQSSHRHLGISSILKPSTAKTLHPFWTIFFLLLSSQHFPPAPKSAGMSPKVMGQERAIVAKWKSDFMGLFILVFLGYLALGTLIRHALFWPIYLLCVFHKLQLQDAAGLQPVLLLPDWVLFAWDLSGDVGTAHNDTFAQSGQQESWHLVM